MHSLILLSFRQFIYLFSHNILTLLKYKGTISSKHLTQLTFACSKSAIETLEKGVKYVQNYIGKSIFTS